MTPGHADQQHFDADAQAELQTSTGTIRLRPEDAAGLPDEELRDLVRSALDPRPGADPTS